MLPNLLKKILFFAVDWFTTKNNKLLQQKKDHVTTIPKRVINNIVFYQIDWQQNLPTRVNSANVLHEGLRIERRGRRMNSKVNIRQTRRGLMCIENKRVAQLTQSQSVPGRPLLAPLYRWPGLEDPVGFNTNYNVCIWYHLVFWLHLCLGLPNGPRGYQDNGPY
jgi:hypothetical protein